MFLIKEGIFVIALKQIDRQCERPTDKQTWLVRLTLYRFGGNCLGALQTPSQNSYTLFKGIQKGSSFQRLEASRIGDWSWKKTENCDTKLSTNFIHCAPKNWVNFSIILFFVSPLTFWRNFRSLSAEQEEERGRVERTILLLYICTCHYFWYISFFFFLYYFSQCALCAII